MTLKLFVIAGCAAALLVATASADAKDKRRTRHAKAPHTAEQPRFGMPGFQQGPARMIEVRPGLWISSYGCVTDDGYGRILPCDVTESSAH